MACVFPSSAVQWQEVGSLRHTWWLGILVHPVMWPRAGSHVRSHVCPSAAEWEPASHGDNRGALGQLSVTSF